MTRKRAHPGFSLIELMVAITILGVLTAMALPAYRNYILAQRVRAATTELHASLVLARSESIKTNATVTITRTSSLWRDGWTVTRADGSRLLSQDAFNQITIDGPASGSVVFLYSGRPNSTSAGAAFTLYYDSNASGAYDSDDRRKVQGRCVTLTLAGLPESETC